MRRMRAWMAAGAALLIVGAWAAWGGQPAEKAAGPDRPAAGAGGDVKVVAAVVEETRHKRLVPSKHRGGPITGLKLTLHVTGGPAAGATRFGHVALTEAVDDRGTSLEKSRSVFGRKQREGFVTIDDWKRRGVEGGFAVELRLAETPRAATKIARLSGSLKVLSGGKTAEVVVKDARSLAGKAVDDATLTAAGLKVTVVQTKTGIMMDPKKSICYRLSGNEGALLDAELVDASGGPVKGSSGSFRRGDGPRTHVLSAREKLPEKAGLKLKVLVGAETATVPIALTDVPLP